MKMGQRKLTKEERSRRDADDLEKLNRAADELNLEAEDVLEYTAFDRLFEEGQD